MSNTTVYRALEECGIGASQELFKFILNGENKERRLVSSILAIQVPSCLITHVHTQILGK